MGVDVDGNQVFVFHEAPPQQIRVNDSRSRATARSQARPSVHRLKSGHPIFKIRQATPRENTKQEMAIG
jgi:hypothetical protein